MPRFAKRFVVIAVAATIGLLGLFVAQRVSADTNVGVTIGVGDTTLTIAGYASPQAFVTVRDGAATVGTTQADAAGVFSVDLSAQAAGTHQYVITAEDINNVTSDAASLFVSLTEHSHNSASIFLPPSFTLPTQVNYAQPIHIAGSTVPNVTVSIVVDGHTNDVVADGNGQWSFDQASDVLGSGAHVIFVYATNTSSETSYDSDLHVVEVGQNPNQPPAQLPTESPSSPSVETPASRPTSPVITYPSANAQLPNGVNEIRGRAEPGRIINLYNGKQLLGSTVADANGDWVIRISLDGGSYEFFAQACDGNSVCSALSGGVSFSVEPAQSPAGPLTISLDPYSQKTTTGSKVSLKITTNKVSGYRMKIIWDDGQVDSVTANSATVTVNHMYRDAGLFAGTVWAEANGQVAVASFSVIVTSQPVIQNVTTIVAASLIAVVTAAIGLSSLIFGSPAAGWNWLASLIKRLLR